MLPLAPNPHACRPGRQLRPKHPAKGGDGTTRRVGGVIGTIGRNGNLARQIRVIERDDRAFVVQDAFVGQETLRVVGLEPIEGAVDEETKVLFAQRDEIGVDP